MKAISIILPVYNVEKYIIKCLDSIIDQTFHDFELIIIDDCGNDNSIQLCEAKLRDSTISYKIIHNKVNQGVAESRNIGINNSMSNYILFVDPDDWVDPLILEKLYTTAINNSADIVSCMTMHFWEGSNTYTEYKGISNIRVGEYKSTEYLNQYFHGIINAEAWGRLIKRKLFNNTYFPGKVPFEDTLIMPYLIEKANKVIQLENTLYFYVKRNSDTNLTNKKQSNIDGFLFYLNKMKNHFILTHNLNKFYTLEFIYMTLLNLTYTVAHYSQEYSEIKSDLHSISTFINTKDIFSLRKTISKKYILFLLLLKTSKYLFFLSYKITIKTRYN